MKTINSLVLCMGLLISLCSRNVSTFCGNDDQIHDIQTAVVVYESWAMSYMIMTSLSHTIPINAAALTAVQVISSIRFDMYIKEVFEEMKSSMNKDHVDTEKCSEILDKTRKTNRKFEKLIVGLSIVAVLPAASGGLAHLATRLAATIYAIFVMRNHLVDWKLNGCQYITTRDCNL